MKHIRVALTVALVLIGSCTLTAWSQADLKPSGTVSADGKRVEGNGFIQDGNVIWFPILDIAKSLGKTATFDQASSTLTWEGNTTSPEVKMVQGTPYVRWADLLKFAPGMTIAMAPGRVLLSSQAAAANLRDSWPPPPSIGQTPPSVPRFLVANAQHPGEDADVRNFVVPGRYTIMDFYSRFCPPSRHWNKVLEELANQRNDIIIREVDIDRPGGNGIDFDSPIGRHYVSAYGAVPFFLIFDDQRRMIAAGDTAEDMVLYLLLQTGWTKEKLRKAQLIK